MSLVVPFNEIFADESGLLTRHSTWKRTELGQVCTIVNGYPFKSSLFNRDKGFPIIRIRDLGKNRTETRYNGEIPEESLVRNGDLLIGMDGIFRCVEWLGGNAGLNQRVCKIIPNEGFLDHKFLLFGINGYLKAIEDATSSVTVGHLSSHDVLKIPFPLAPLNEQRRIVAKLETLLGKVDACQQRLTKIAVLLKRFRQSVLAAACSGRLTADWRDGNDRVESAQGFFEKIITRRQEAWKERANGRYKRKYPAPENFDSENLPDVPESWMWVSADAICSQITDGEHIQPPYQTEGYPMLSAKHVRDGFVTIEDAGLISESDFKKALQRCEPVNGDVLIVSVGATTGRAAIIRDCPPFAIVRSVLLLKPLVPAEFFLRWLQSPWCFRWMTRASGASAQPHFYIRDTKRLPVAFPPLDEQQEIVRRVEALFVLADQIEARYAKAKAHVEKLTQSILAKAFRGELVPQDPNDLPAPRPGVWFVYVLECADGSHYIGHTDDVEKRWCEHAGGRGSNWCRAHPPVKLAHWEQFDSREAAVGREKDLKTGFGRKWLKREIAAGRTRQAGEPASILLERIRTADSSSREPARRKSRNH